MSDNRRLILAKDILDFLKAYAKTSADFDPVLDAPDERFNGPDSAMFYHAAQELLRGAVSPAIQSSWRSGCYAPMHSKDGETVHDSLITRLKSFRY